MASIEVIDTRHTRLEVGIYDLQYRVNEYDKFVYRYSQNGTQILAYTCDWATSSSHSFTFCLQNDDYLGNNWFAPNTTYSLTADCWYNGRAYPVGPVQFRTDSISPPSGTIAPYLYPMVKEQDAEDCVAMSLSTAMEIIKGKETGISEQYSVSFIFGSDERSDENMYMDEAIDLCKTYGSPRWELVATSYPDSEDKQEAQDIFQNACSLAQVNAKKQAFTGSRNIDFYDCAAVASAIRKYGFFQFNYHIPYNMHWPPASGIIPQPDEWTGENHSMALIGLTTINGKPHWIAHNSWGTDWGKDGIGYIPYDWGCGAQSPQDRFNTDQCCGWTCNCYSVWNGRVASTKPSAPTGLSGAQDGANTTATMRWTLPSSDARLLLYARKKGTSPWWPKPSYGALFAGSSGKISFDADTTAYEVMAIAVRDNLLSPQTAPITISISLLELWSWSLSNGSATQAQTRRAHSAITGKGATTDFSYLVWNDLVTKLYDAVKAVGQPWDTTQGYGSFNATLMRQSDKAMTAKRFNAARYNLGRNHSTGLPVVSTGDMMNGSYFVTLAKKLNEWIQIIQRGG